MKLLKNMLFKRILISILVFIILVFFCVSPMSYASKVKMEDNEFYYAGTTEGQYVVTQGIFEWLLSKIGEIVDFLLGLMTMGGRMVFVGWTALFEELLTWTLEATMGVPLDIENEVNATVLDGQIASSNNITVEAIVYNQVPILNINIFENTLATCVSGTGQFFIECEACYNAQNTNGASPAGNADEDEKFCRMPEKCTCQNCWKVLAEKGYIETDASGAIKLDADGQPIRKTNAITTIKDYVAKWYYVMRLISIVAMLCVLILVGIKMAFTNIASDKALYKRMLVDWIVGMILIFTIHYFMIAIINFNEIFVNFIKDTEDKTVTELTKKEFHADTKENEDIEISIYQAVRTRAYDPKLINGTTGMILYMTLVFYAVRFTFTYLKRYLNVIILTLLAPGVAFAYAIQKVLTGKSRAFGNWFHEYFINVIIQTVHALVYTIFVSTALVISLNSISGMILAFVFMNFMLKADDIFRKIFKLSGGSADEAMNAAKNAREMFQSAKSAVTFMTAGNLLKKTPVTKAVMAPLKTARTGAVLAAVNIKSKLDDRKPDRSVEEASEKSEQLEETAKKLQMWREQLNIINKKHGVAESAPKKEFKKYMDYYEGSKRRKVDENGEEIIEKDAISLDGEDAIEKEMTDLEGLAHAAAMRDSRAKELYDQLQKEREKFDALTNITTKDVIKGHLDQFLDKKNYYEYDANKGKYKRKYGYFGKVKYDRTQNKWVKHTTSELISEQLKSENLLGFTDADKKLWKETKGFVKGTFVGMGSLFVGLGTVVSNPGIGMGLLATGLNNQMEFLDKTGISDPNREYRPPVVSEKRKKYTFNRFNKGAKQQIASTILAKAEGEKDKIVVENVRKNHQTLYNTLKLGGGAVTALGVGALVMGSAGAATPLIITGVVGRQIGKNVKRYSGYSQNSLMGKINKQHFKQVKELREELVKDEVRLLAEDEKLEMEDTYQQLVTSIEAALNPISTPNVKTIEEERKEQEKIALKAETAVQTDTGNVIILDSPKNQSDEEIIKEAVAKVMVTKMVDAKTDIQSLQTEGNENQIKSIFEENKGNAKNEVKAMIEKQLVAKGSLKAGEKLESKIKNIDEQISKQVDTILKEEEQVARRNMKKSSTDSQTQTDDDSAYMDMSIESDSKPNKRKKLTTLEKVMLDEVVKEQVQNGDIKQVSDLTKEKVLQGVSDKKASFASKKASNDVIASMKKGKEPKVNFTDQVKISEESAQLMQARITQIKQSNTPLPKTDKDRREEKKKRIKALDSILMAAANNEDTIVDASNKEIQKTPDEVITELFQNTVDRDRVQSLINNIENMKSLNIRGENLEMKTKNRHYNEHKRIQKRREAYQAYPELVSEERKNQNLDSHKETYGPVTDIVQLIKDVSANEEIGTRQKRTRLK